MLNWKPGFYTTPDFRGGNTEWKTCQGFASKGRSQFCRCFAGPGDDEKLRKLRQFFRFAPKVQLRGLIRADEVKQFRAGKFFLVVAHRVDAIRNSTATQFAVVNFRRRVPGKREMNEAKSFVRRR